GSGHDSGSYTTGQWTAGVDATGHYDAYAAQHYPAYDSGFYDATQWNGEQQIPLIPTQGTAPEASGQCDAAAWLQPDPSDGTGVHTQHWEWGTQAFDTGAYDATRWNGEQSTSPATPEAYAQQPEAGDAQATSAFDQAGHPDGAGATGESGSHDDTETTARSGDTGELPRVPLLEGPEEFTPASAPRPAGRAAARSRRRPPAKRSALLTVAVPSACVMGVAGIAAASVGDLTDDGGQETKTTAADAQPVKPSAANVKLDTQLESLAAGADDFADRASRTQERIDLKAQQEAERRRAAEEAARKERLRPKFALPVALHGLSAFYGQAGTNWMSVHTGIDFPVPY